MKTQSAKSSSANFGYLRTKILGVVVIVCALLLFVCAVIPANGVLSTVLSAGLRLVLGIGSFLLPLFLIVVGASFFLPQEESDSYPTYFLLGFLLILIGLLVFLALLTPSISPENASALFEGNYLYTRGGLCGAGLAWIFLTLLGIVGARVVAIALVIAGFVPLGFSISRILHSYEEKKRKANEKKEATLGCVPGYDPYAKTIDIRNGGGAKGLFSRSFASWGAKAQEGAPGANDSSAPASEGAFETQTTQKLSDPLQASLVENGKRAADFDGFDENGKTQAPIRKRASASKARRQDGMAASKSAFDPFATPRPEDGFLLPDTALLKRNESDARSRASAEDLRDTAVALQGTLEDFGIMASVVDWVAGPTVTLFKVSLPAGVRVSRITALNDDIALALAAPGGRIFAPVPGSNFVGIEVPNAVRQAVLLGDILQEAPSGPLQVAIGMDVEGNKIVSDLAKMPHLLIGGTTGSGKSVSINSMIMSILMRATPSEVRFIMIDPKRVEFTPFNGIPHLYVPVVTEAKEAASALAWGVAEMERRLKVFSKVGARNIGQYNAKVQSGELEDEGSEELPYIVIVIDELADLMMNVGKEVEFSISRIAQLARAAGIHLIVATQRPSANIVTGVIKANITNRIALNVASSIDSRVILDTPGAESLIGHGDLLLSKPEYSKPLRIQGCYVSDEEINAVVEHLKEQATPEYHSEILSTNLISVGGNSAESFTSGSLAQDPLLWEAADVVVSGGLGSTSNIQRRLKVGYSRAGRLMDMLEEKGVVGPPNGSRPREVLVDAMELEALKAFEENDALQAKE